MNNNPENPLALLDHGTAEFTRLLCANVASVVHLALEDGIVALSYRVVRRRLSDVFLDGLSDVMSVHGDSEER